MDHAPTDPPQRRARKPADTTSQLADGHRRTRRAHASETAEDYVEIISDLIARRGEARVVDVAACLGVTHVTVSRTVARLRKAGWVHTEPYRSLFLTQAGVDLARKVKRRHEVVERFLRALGVSEQAARADAEGLEHHVSDETLRAFERFVDREGSGRAPGRGSERRGA
jgi:DtxR family manganese transport transcriptional regulator